MRILYLSQYFPPEIGAGENRAFEMVKNLKRLGHKITVITEFPNYPFGVVPKTYRFRLFERTNFRGIEVIRSYVKASPERSFKNRILLYLSFFLTSLWAGLKLKKRFDLVYATSPPLFVGLAGYLISRIKNSKFVFEVRDIWPDAAIVLGQLKNKALIQVSHKIEKLCYKEAQRIIVATQGLSFLLQEKSVSSDKIEVVFNGVNTQFFKYVPENKFSKEKIGYKGKFLALYFGTIGLAHGVDTLVEVANLLKGEYDIQFLLVGNGPDMGKIKRLKDLYQLNNVKILKEKPREEILELIAAADVCLVPVRKKKFFKSALPVKMFEAWACGRPIVLSVDGEAKEHLKKAQAGVWVKPEDVVGIKDAILFLYDNPQLCRRFGRNGRSYVERHFSRRVQAERLEKMLVKVADKG